MDARSPQSHVRTLLSGAGRLLGGGWIDEPGLARLHRRTLERDPLGEVLHGAFAALWCFMLAWPTTYVELAAIPVLATFVVRQWVLWRWWRVQLSQPIVVVLLAWAAWQGVTLAWSPDVHHGLKELGALRFAWALPVLLPVLDRRRWLIAAMVCGFVFGMLSQAAHAAGTALGIEQLTWPRLADRNSGWWDPVVGGSLLAGALGLVVSAAVHGRGPARLTALSLSIATLVAIAGTGTRGAMIAAGGVIAFGAARALARGVRGLCPKRAALWGVCGLVVIVVAGVIVGPAVVRRIAQARDDVAGAIQRGEYSSDTGARIGMWIWAGRAAMAHPVGGVGAGGYQAWTVQQTKADPDAPRVPVHAHAHSAYLHALATTGLVGLGLFSLVLVAGLIGGTRGPTLGAYDHAPVYALLGLVLAGLFDPVQLNAQTSAMLMTVLALCQYPRVDVAGPEDR